MHNVCRFRNLENNSNAYLWACTNDVRRKHIQTFSLHMCVHFLIICLFSCFQFHIEMKSWQATCVCVLCYQLRCSRIRRFSCRHTHFPIMLIFNVKNSIHYDEIGECHLHSIVHHTHVRHLFCQIGFAFTIHNQSSIICGSKSFLGRCGEAE